MSKGYLIAHLKEHDQEGMDKFKQMAGPTIGEHGGKVLVREPSPDVREGENLGTVVLIEFESIDAARGFYESMIEIFSDLLNLIELLEIINSSLNSVKISDRI